MARNLYTALLLTLTQLPYHSPAQDIHFTPFNATMTMFNPAVTGMFDGRERAVLLYRNEWASQLAPYITVGANVDFPILTTASGNYVAAGVQYLNDRAGDGDIGNNYLMVSGSYHMLFGKPDSASAHYSELAFGLQGTYAQNCLNISPYYFDDPIYRGFSIFPIINYQPKNYLLANAGVTFSHSTGKRFSYIIGISANDLPPAPESNKYERQNREVELHCNAIAGAIWNVSDRFSLRPAAMFETRYNTNVVVAGNEFQFAFSDPARQNTFISSIYLGGWYRSGDIATVTAGITLRSFQLGLGWDINMESANATGYGNGSLEVQARFIIPGKASGRRKVACARF